MTGRAFVVVLALLAGAVSATAGASCTSTSTIIPTGIDEPPTLRIVSPGEADCVAVPDSPDAVVPVTVDVAGSFYLRPPGSACVDLYNCGYLQLYVDGSPNATSGTATVNANFGNFGNKYGPHTLTVELVWDLNDGGGQDMLDAQITYDGSIPPTVYTCDSDGGLVEAGAPDASGVGSLPPTGTYQTTVCIVTAPTCAPKDGGTGGRGTGGAPPSDAGTGGAGGAPSDGGADGAGGAPSDGGADGAGGAGGAGGAPADAGDAGATDAAAGG
jgi:hypothetical protein